MGSRIRIQYQDFGPPPVPEPRFGVWDLGFGSPRYQNRDSVPGFGAPPGTGIGDLGSVPEFGFGTEIWDLGFGIWYRDRPLRYRNLGLVPRFGIWAPPGTGIWDQDWYRGPGLGFGFSTRIWDSGSVPGSRMGIGDRYQNLGFGTEIWDSGSGFGAPPVPEPPPVPFPVPPPQSRGPFPSPGAGSGSGVSSGIHRRRSGPVPGCGPGFIPPGTGSGPGSDSGPGSIPSSDSRPGSGSDPNF